VLFQQDSCIQNLTTLASELPEIGPTFDSNQNLHGSHDLIKPLSRKVYHPWSSTWNDEPI